ncbi:hypothetical protein H072_11226 [Dactylellina haptotyla CBS 200.50]|uniref:DNA (cytosine-5-)-methyltransferase n=1 Tax=Dactylellina haptotyla (strain CBS 200.50) TaxID=1284197 RepID=S8A2M4_DACHA|nr:hypothetical protein H072_11226 [Dactylellina haptotyla CBS 200.50]
MSSGNSTLKRPLVGPESIEENADTFQSDEGFESPYTYTTPSKKRRTVKIEPTSMPDNLRTVQQLTIFRPAKPGENIDYQEISLHVGGCVELEPDIIPVGDTKALKEGYFLRIAKIKTSYDAQFVIGQLFKRARNGYKLFQRTPGAVFLLKDKVAVDASHIVRIRELILTNNTDPTCGGILPPEETAGEEDGRLICRYRATIADNSHERLTGSAKMVIGGEGFIRGLLEFEADPAFRYPQEEIRKKWMSVREQKIEAEKQDMDAKAIDLTNTIELPNFAKRTPQLTSLWRSKKNEVISTKRIIETTNGTSKERSIQVTKTSETFRQQHSLEEPAQRRREQKLQPSRSRRYTFADYFCGAGGASCGAKMAGLNILYGMDSWEPAIKSYAANYGQSKAIQADICDFVAGTSNVKLQAQKLHADVVHISPPCQYYSPVHTNPGRDDEKNEVASLVILELLKVVRPRIVTLEQTFGISNTRKFRDHFTIFINQFVCNNYSVRWAVKDATEYGAASARRRLIIIASAPGETLPPFPTATSFNPFKAKGGPNYQDLPETPTIGDILASIPPNAANHDPAPYKFPQLSPFRINQPHNKTITCGGGDSKVHPSGTRPFTVRELATFQTFPTDYKFGEACDGKIIKQIGNAWPPKFAKSIFEAIVKHLERVDAEERQEDIL